MLTVVGLPKNRTFQPRAKGIEDIARIAQKLEEQQNLILSLHDESRSLKRDLFQIRQAQMNVRHTDSKKSVNFGEAEPIGSDTAGLESDRLVIRRKTRMVGRSSRSVAKRSFLKR